MTADYSLEACKARHDAIKDDVNEIREKISGLEAKFWAIITLLFGNLVGIVVMLARTAR